MFALCDAAAPALPSAPALFDVDTWPHHLTPSRMHLPERSLRTCRVNVKRPTVEIRFQDLHAETTVYLDQSRNIPNLLNAVREPFIVRPSPLLRHLPAACDRPPQPAVQVALHLAPPSHQHAAAGQCMLCSAQVPGQLSSSWASEALAGLQRATSLFRRNDGATTKLVILDGISGVLKPGRITLLLGPPSSGKTTLLKALSGRLEHSGLQVRLCHTWGVSLETWPALGSATLGADGPRDMACTGSCHAWSTRASRCSLPSFLPPLQQSALDLWPDIWVLPCLDIQPRGAACTGFCHLAWEALLSRCSVTSGTRRMFEFGVRSQEAVLPDLAAGSSSPAPGQPLVRTGLWQLLLGQPPSLAGWCRCSWLMPTSLVPAHIRLRPARSVQTWGCKRRSSVRSCLPSSLRPAVLRTGW